MGALCSAQPGGKGGRMLGDGLYVDFNIFAGSLVCWRVSATIYWVSVVV